MSWSKFFGTLSTYFRVGPNGVRLKSSSSSILEIRTGSDSTYADLIVNNLTVKGTQTTIEANTVAIGDNILQLNTNATVLTSNAGISVYRPSATDAVILWDGSNSLWKAGLLGSEAALILEGDSRLTNPRTPNAHASSHLPGGTDALAWASAIHAVGTLAGRSAAAASNAGLFYFATDDQGGTLYRSNGSAWSAVSTGLTQAPNTHASSHLPGGTDALAWSGSIHAVGTLAGRPAAAASNAGLFYFASDDTGGTLYRSNGTAWSALSPGLSHVHSASAITTGQLAAARGGTGLDTSGTTADNFLYTSATGVWASASVTTFARSLLDDATALAARTTLGAENASNLTAGTLAVARGGTGLDTSALVADRLLYTSATGVFGNTTLTSFARTLLDDVDAATARTTLGVVNQSSNVVLTDITTLAYNSAATIALFTLPANAVIHMIQLRGLTAYNGSSTATLSIGIAGSTSKYASSADFDLTQPDPITIFPDVAAPGSSENLIATFTAATGATTGAATLLIMYSVPA